MAAVSRRYFRQERAHGRYVVCAYSIAATDEVAFTCYEPLVRDAATGRYSHSTSFTSETHGRLGSIRSRALPAAIDAIPYGSERTAACQAWFATNDCLAETVIMTAFPEVPFRSLRDGEGFADLDDVNAAVAA